MLNILHLSDLHFGEPYLPRVGEAVLRAAHTMMPDLLIVSGDVTQRAKRQEFAAARAYLDRLPALPRLVVPGNHDVPLYRIWERLWCPYRLYQQYITPERNTVVRRDDAIVVGLDTSNPYGAITNGRIRTTQLDLCAEAFTHAPADAYRIVVFHHHLAPAPDYDKVEMMPRAKQILEALTALKVDLIMAGHLHRAYIANSLDLYAGADRQHGMIIVQCGTTTSRRGRAREREKNSFNWIQLTAQSMRIIHYMYFTEQDGFAAISQHEFARPSRGMLRVGLDAPSNTPVPYTEK
jgi:3',5'-cyclic AMP phosphodiesterase CpdA